MKKSLRKFLAVIIVLSMVFTSHAFVTFAENFENVSNEMELEKEKDESFDVESEVENDEESEAETLPTIETNLDDEASDDQKMMGAGNELVGASSTSPEDETSEENVGASSANPEDETSEENVGASSTSPEEIVEPEAEEPEEDETDYPEEPEEDETEATVEASEVVVGASSTSPEEETSNSEETAETEVEVETEDKLFGATNKYLSYIDISQYTKKTYYVGDTYDPSDLKIKAYYEDADTGEEEWVEVAYIDDKSKFSFSPDCVNSPFTASTTEENPYELTITYDDGTNDPFCTQLFQVHPATTPTPTEQKFCIKYFNITGTNWTSIASREEVHNIINNPIVKEFTASTDTSEVAAAIGTLGYTNGFKKLTKDEYDNYTGIGAATHTSDEEINNIAKENGVFDQWKLSPTETVYYGINYYYYDAEMNYAENHSSGTWEIYDNTFDWNTDLSPHELVAFHNNNAEEAIVLPQVTVKGSDTYKMRNTSTGDIQYIWTWALQPGGMQERSFGDTENAWPFKPETKTLTLYAQWYGSTPTPPTPPTPTPVTTDWYWYLDGTHMHYTATAGAGRTKVTFNGDLGVDYGSTDVKTVTEVTIDDKISPENLHGLFRLFTSLTKINSFTNLDTSNCTDMARMFQSCSSLENINVSHFNTSKVKDMSRVFQNCEKLKSIDVSNFDTQNAETMHQMFGTCIVITDIKFSSKFVTNKVTKMYEMFSRCEKIASLDISSFDISSVTNASDMFASCHELVTIKTSPTLDFSSVGSGNDMFKYCFKIKGGKGTTYDENHVDKSYAHVDGGTSNAGYFTSSGGPTPPTPGGGQSGGNSNGKNNGGDSSSDSGDASPTEGPMGDLTKDPEYADKLVNRDVNTENNIPQSSLLKNDALVTMLKSLPENSSTPYTNAKDQYGNTGFGQWLNVPGTTTWYFNTGNLNGNSGLLRNGWYNLGWRGVDEWYHFDSNGVMDIGWYEEDGKTYYLLYDFSNHWYGKVVTGTQVINGQVYNFDSNGVLII